DVFIPLHGKGVIDNRFQATVVVEGADSAAPRVTVSIEGPTPTPEVHAGMALGDTFPWGPHVATVVRVVNAQEGAAMGLIGWVEIGIAPLPPPPDASAPAAPAGSPRNPPRDPPRPAGSRSSAN